MNNNIESAENIYVVGIKGNGTSAIAHILSSFGKKIEGSDVNEDFITKPLLNSLLITPDVFGSKESFKDYDLVIYSTSVTAENPDLTKAMKEGVPCITYPEALGALAKLYAKSIAVCGSHGKSTITSLLGYALEQQLDPTVLVGAEVVNWGGSARVGESRDIFVYEADEYQNKFKHYFPNIVVVNNINFEHPDFFTDFEMYKQAFTDFINKLPEDGLVIANIDHPVVEDVVKDSGKNVIWYGEKEGADIRLTGRSYADGIQSIEINGEEAFQLQLIGKHNALNALAVVALGKHLGLGTENINKAFSTFKSTKRRHEIIGTVDGRIVIDDFAHHPTEIVASVAALKEAYPERRLVVVFQSHTFTRTDVLIDDFATAFIGVDDLVLIPIFGSAREKQGKISTEDFKDAIGAHTPNVHIENDLEAAHAYLKENSKPNDLIVTMGAGDTWQLAKALID